MILNMDKDMKEIHSYNDESYSISFYNQFYNLNYNDQIPLHWHHELQLTWLIEGSLEYSINEDMITLDSDQILFINSRQFHTSRTLSKASRTYELNFMLDFFSPALIETAISPLLNNKNLDYILLPKTANGFNEVLDAIESSDSISMVHILHLILKVFSYFDTYDVNAYTNTENIQHTAFSKMLHFAENNYDRNIQVGDIAKSAHINRTKCTELFKFYTKKSPMRYVNDYRLFIGKKLLLQTSQTITEVSQNVGFNQVSYFIQNFKTKYGITPKQFQIKQKNDIQK